MEKLDLVIGGYFGLLEMSDKKYMHDNLLSLNTGRNAFEYILRARTYNHVYIPFFTCNVLLEPLEKLNINYTFYDVDNNLEPIFDYNKIGDNEGFLITNYFGIKSDFIGKVAKSAKNLIVDNAQAFFDSPLTSVDTFYSPRKFFGVADGAYLSTTALVDIDLQRDFSFDRMSHLLKRTDIGAENGYVDFKNNDSSLEVQPIKKMSLLTSTILSNFDYAEIETIRKSNFYYLHNKLKIKNLLKLNVDKTSVPMIYPFRIKNAQEIKERLATNKIFCATYWPNVFEWCTNDKNAFHLSKEILALPIDQRYSEKDMQKILDYV